MKEYLNKKFFQPLKQYLKQGLTPEKLALTIAVAFSLGLIPLWGSVTALCFVFATLMRLNLPVMILVTTLTTPLHLLGYVVFINMGIGFFGASALTYSAEQIFTLIQEDFRTALQELWYVNLLGIIVWAAFSLPIAAITYYIMLPILRRISSTFSSQEEVNPELEF